ncbi:MAG TPA: triphosphoribosyl-dephospho-CoA synthase [Gammaproteobacteria bacterium]|nr:triphosphoribosyl-dephospho-CoA synthase [Gammaproteobacteria bacterium]
MKSLSPDQVQAVVREACNADVQAFKPGNVSVDSAGHRMQAEHFLHSADLVAPVLARPDLTVGQRIEQAVDLTMAQVGCNTNLGIVLLLAPLAQAALLRFSTDDFQERLGRVLRALTQTDAAAAYRAIRQASPAGLGHHSQQDVGMEPEVTLLEAMQLAADRDQIARQYAQDYADIFTLGVTALKEGWARGWGREWGAVACYLAFLSRIPDTHICRKYGREVAEMVRQEAAGVETDFKACENSTTAYNKLLSFDNKLKQGGYNPGTSADLTVASWTACRLQTFLKEAPSHDGGGHK